MSESTELMNMQYCELVEYESKHVAAHENVSTHIQQVIQTHTFGRTHHGVRSINSDIQSVQTCVSEPASFVR